MESAGIVVEQETGRKVFTLLIETRCNSFCLFCGEREIDEALIRTRRRLNLTVPRPEHEVVPQRYTVESATEALRRARVAGYTHVSLQGGEPTVFPDLPAVIAHARGLDFEYIGMVSNGRKLADAAYAREILGAGLDGITLSLLGPNAETHDRLAAAPGSFDAVCAALRNVSAISGERAQRVSTSVNIIVSALNVDTLAAHVELIASLGVQTGVLHVVRFDHMASDPTVRELIRFDAAKLPGALADATEAAERCGVRLHIEDIPPCLHPKLRAVEFGRLVERASVTGHRFEAPAYSYDLYLGAPEGIPENCQGCMLVGACKRLPVEHAGQGAAFRAITLATIANGLDDLLASLDPALGSSVAQVRDYQALIGSMARWRPDDAPALASLRARVDEAIADLALHAFRHRHADAFNEAAAAWLRMHPMRSPIVSNARWDLVAAASLRWMNNPPDADSGTVALRLGDMVDVLIRGRRNEEGAVLVARGVGVRLATNETDPLRRALQRVWCFIGAAVLELCEPGTVVDVRGTEVRFERPNGRSAHWVGTNGPVAAAWA